MLQGLFGEEATLALSKCSYLARRCPLQELEICRGSVTVLRGLKKPSLLTPGVTMLCGWASDDGLSLLWFIFVYFSRIVSVIYP